MSIPTLEGGARESGSTIYCIPHAGGVASEYSGWRGALGEWAVKPVCLPGREARFSEPLLESVEAMAEDVARPIPFGRPVALFGHSLGALVAFETARILESRGQEVSLVALSGHVAPGHESGSRPLLHRLPDEELVRELVALGGMERAVVENEELLELIVPRLRADLRAAETYAPRPGAAIGVPLAAFGGTEDDHVERAGLAAWESRTRSRFTLRMFAGDHFYLRSSRMTLIEALRQILGSPP